MSDSTTTGKPLLTLAWESLRNAQHEQPFLIRCLGLFLLVGVIALGRSFINLWHLTADEIDAASEVGEC